MAERKVFWIRTVGAPRSGDPRDGELHQFFDRLPDHFDLEPWGDKEDAPSEDAHYVRSDAPPVTDDEGRDVWIFEYRPSD